MELEFRSLLQQIETDSVSYAEWFLGFLNKKKCKDALLTLENNYATLLLPGDHPCHELQKKVIQETRKRFELEVVVEFYKCKKCEMFHSPTEVTNAKLQLMTQKDETEDGHEEVFESFIDLDLNGTMVFGFLVPLNKKYSEYAKMWLKVDDTHFEFDYNHIPCHRTLVIANQEKGRISDKDVPFLKITQMPFEV